MCIRDSQYSVQINVMIISSWPKYVINCISLSRKGVLIPSKSHKNVMKMCIRDSGHKVHIHVPQKGTKEKLVELAKKNAQLVLSTDKERLKREEGLSLIHILLKCDILISVY